MIFRGGRLACLYYCRTDISAPPSTDSPAPFVPPGVSYSMSTQCNFMSQYCVHLPAMGHDQPQKTRISKHKGGVFSHCAGAFSVGNGCVHSRTACECRKFSSVATLKVLFFRIVPCFFSLCRWYSCLFRWRAFGIFGSAFTRTNGRGPVFLCMT